MVLDEMEKKSGADVIGDFKNPGCKQSSQTDGIYTISASDYFLVQNLACQPIIVCPNVIIQNSITGYF